MTARQALQVHVGFEFGMKLLAGAMIVVEPDHLLRRQLIQAAPIGIDLILGKQQPLALFGLSFGDFKDDWVGQWIAVDIYNRLSDPYLFSRAAMVLRSGLLCQINPLLGGSLRRLRLMMK